MNIDIFTGHIAGILTVTTFLPQLIFIWKIKSAKDVSMVMLVVNQIAGIFWIIYAILTSNIILFIYDGLVDIINLMLICSKIYFDNYYIENQIEMKNNNSY